jgi:hypothetical protein
MRDIEGDVAGNECFERCLAAQKLTGQCEQKRRMLSREHQQGVDEGIGFDESSVEIDTERPECCYRRFRRRDDLGQPLTSTQS